MKKIINGKRYDTESARKVADYWHGASSRDFDHYEEALYCKRTGEYFLAGEGGPMTKYARSVGQNTTSGGSAIILLTYEDARQWAEDNLSYQDYEKEFVITDEQPNLNLANKIKAAREAASLSQKQLAELMGIGQPRVAEWEGGSDIKLTSLYAIAKALGIDEGDLFADEMLYIKNGIRVFVKYDRVWLQTPVRILTDGMKQIFSTIEKDTPENRRMLLAEAKAYAEDDT